MNNHNQQKPRGGFPCKRDRRRESKFWKKGVAYSNLLDRFKRVGKTIYVLHATRGWKKYA